MDIFYDNSKIKKLLTKEDNLIKKYGRNISDTIFLIIQYLRNADNLSAISQNPPYRRHKLQGNYQNCYAMNITGKLRLIFKPVNEKECELMKIKEIIIVDVKDYHD